MRNRVDSKPPTDTCPGIPWIAVARSKSRLIGLGPAEPLATEMATSHATTSGCEVVAYTALSAPRVQPPQLRYLIHIL